MRKNPDEKHTSHLHIKLTPSVHETLLKKAKTKGLTISTYARMILKAAADER